MPSSVSRSGTRRRSRSRGPRRSSNSDVDRCGNNHGSHNHDHRHDNKGGGGGGGRLIVDISSITDSDRRIGSGGYGGPASLSGSLSKSTKGTAFTSGTSSSRESRGNNNNGGGGGDGGRRSGSRARRDYNGARSRIQSSGRGSSRPRGGTNHHRDVDGDRGGNRRGGGGGAVGASSVGGRGAKNSGGRGHHATSRPRPRADDDDEDSDDGDGAIPVAAMASAAARSVGGSRSRPRPRPQQDTGGDAARTERGTTSHRRHHPSDRRGGGDAVPSGAKSVGALSSRSAKRSHVDPRRTAHRDLHHHHHHHRRDDDGERSGQPPRRRGGSSRPRQRRPDDDPPERGHGDDGGRGSDRRRSRSRPRSPVEEDAPSPRGHQDGRRHNGRRPDSLGDRSRTKADSRSRPPPSRGIGGGGGDDNDDDWPLRRRHRSCSRPRERSGGQQQPAPRMRTEQQRQRANEPQQQQQSRDARSRSPHRAREQQQQQQQQQQQKRPSGRPWSPHAPDHCSRQDGVGRSRSRPRSNVDAPRSQSRHASLTKSALDRSEQTARSCKPQTSSILDQLKQEHAQQERDRQGGGASGRNGSDADDRSESPLSVGGGYGERKVQVRGQTPQGGRRGGTPGPCRGNRTRSKSPYVDRRYSERQTQALEEGRRGGGTPGPARKNVSRAKSPYAENKHGDRQAQAPQEGRRRGGTPGPTRRNTEPPQGQGHRQGGTPGQTRRSHSPAERSSRQQTTTSPRHDRRRGGTPGPCRAGPNDANSAQPSRHRSKSSFTSRAIADDELQTDAFSYYSQSSSGTSGSRSSSGTISVAPPRHRLHSSNHSICRDGGGGGTVVTSKSDQSNHTAASRHFLSSEGSVNLDRNGCCVRHPFVQLQRQEPDGRGWRIMSRTCALCDAEDEEEAEKEAAHMKSGASLASAAASATRIVASKALTAKDRVKSAAASVASNRSRRSSSRALDRRSPVGTPLAAAPARPHPLERQHSKLNTTSRRSMVMSDVDDCSDSSESADSSPDFEENESITPSVLELGSDEESKSIGESSASSSSCSSGVSEASESLEQNSSGRQLDLQSLHEMLSVERASKRVDEQRSVVSRRSCRSKKSQGTRSVRPRNSRDGGQRSEQDIIVTEIVISSDKRRNELSKKYKNSKRSTSTGRKKEDIVDMTRVESALQKIKSIEKIQQAATSTVTSDTVASKSVTSNQKQPVKAKNNPPKSPRPPPPKAGNTNPKRPPPPPPPRPKNSKRGNGKINKKNAGISAKTSGGENATGKDNKTAEPDMSTAVLNPHPEPELHSDLPPLIEYGSQPQQLPLQLMSQQQLQLMPVQQQRPMQQQPMQQQPMQQQPMQQQPMQQQPMQQQPMQQQSGESFPEQGQVVNKSKEWMKYSTGFTRREQQAATEEENGGKSSNGKKSKFKMRSGKNTVQEQRPTVRTVKQMPFTDQFGDFGLYTGNVDEDGRPDGKGSMKYDNGVFYEGIWAVGCQDKNAASQYERIRGGFTSWSGKGKSGTKSGAVLPWNARKNDTHDPQGKTNTRGMEWTDLNGDSGRYTGEVNNDQLPHGKGIMRYDFGLIAEGEWVNGILKEGPQDRIMGVAAAMNGGQSVAPGVAIGSGMSVGPGAGGFAGGAVSVLGNGGISVAPGGMGGMMMGQQLNPMMAMANQSRQASQHAMIAHQNLMMKTSMGGSVYGGAGSVYAGGGASVYPGSVMPMQQQAMQLQQQVPQQQPGNNPPVLEINLG